ncbi:MAG: hypothetical protein AAF607_17855, partial [Pseudomonadota bacterium]
LGPTSDTAAASIERQIEPAATKPRPAAPSAAIPTELVSRLSQTTLNFAETRRRAQRQRSMLKTALMDVGSMTGSNWSTAQLQLSRLNEIDVELGVLRDDAASIAGDLAALRARGLPVDALVDETGTLINIIRSEMDQVAQIRNSARATLAS